MPQGTGELWNRRRKREVYVAGKQTGAEESSPRDRDAL